MPRIIGHGRYARETYPDPKTLAAAAGGVLVRAGFDNSVVHSPPTTYPSGNPTTPILRDGVAPMEVVLTGFKPGNVILVGFSVMTVDGEGEDQTGYSGQLFPAIDVGAGFLQIITTSIICTITQQAFPATWLGAVLPPSVTADPKIQVWIASFGADQILIEPFGAWLAAFEFDVSGVTTLPSAVLAPIP